MKTFTGKIHAYFNIYCVYHWRRNSDMDLKKVALVFNSKEDLSDFSEE